MHDLRLVFRTVTIAGIISSRWLCLHAYARYQLDLLAMLLLKEGGIQNIVHKHTKSAGSNSTLSAFLWFVSEEAELVDCGDPD